jgi:hypothetical protein
VLRGPSWQNIQMMLLDMPFTDYDSMNDGKGNRPKEKEKVTYINSLEEHNAAMERLNNRRNG